jgi:hypothetical protein
MNERIVPRFPSTKWKNYLRRYVATKERSLVGSDFEVGDPAGKVATPLVIGLIAAASWALRPPSRRLAGRLW